MNAEIGEEQRKADCDQHSLVIALQGLFAAGQGLLEVDLFATRCTEGALANKKLVELQSVFSEVMAIAPLETLIGTAELTRLARCQHP